MYSTSGSRTKHNNGFVNFSAKCSSADFCVSLFVLLFVSTENG